MSSVTRSGTDATAAGKASTNGTSRKNGHRQRELRKVSDEIAELEQRISNITGMMATLDGERARLMMRVHMLRSAP